MGSNTNRETGLSEKLKGKYDENIKNNVGCFFCFNGG